MELLTALSVGALFALGIFAVLRRNVIRSVIGLMILMNAVNLFLMYTGAYWGREPAYVGDAVLMHSDALPQALVLTAIVISMGGTALVLGMLCVITRRRRTRDMDQINGLKN